jgi:hypothetical protein
MANPNANHTFWLKKDFIFVSPVSCRGSRRFKVTIANGLELMD